MESGRVRGKGKRSKSKRNKMATGPKKVMESSSEDQINAISSSAQEKASTVFHKPLMSKSKRKRVKKVITADFPPLKTAQTLSNVKVASASLTSAKMVVQTPSAASVKPHVVSLTGVKKKKRKLITVVLKEEKVAHRTVTDDFISNGPILEATESPAVTKKRKKIAVLSHVSASPAAGIKPTTTSAVEPFHLDSKKTERSFKNTTKKAVTAHETTSPRKSVKKVKIVASSLTTASLNDASQANVKKLKANTQLKQQEMQQFQELQTKASDAKAHVPGSDEAETLASDAKESMQNTENLNLELPLRLHTASPMISKPQPITLSSTKRDKSKTDHGTSATILTSTTELILPKVSNSTILPNHGSKRRLSIEHAFGTASDETLQPSPKRIAISNIRSDGIDNVVPESDTPNLSDVNTNESHALAKREAMITTPTKYSSTQISQATTYEFDHALPVNQPFHANPLEDKASMTLTPEKKVNSEESTIANVKELQTAVEFTSASPKKSSPSFANKDVFEKVEAAKKVGFSLNSQTCVEKMTMDAGDPNILRSCKSSDSIQATTSTPMCPQESWGASFGMALPSEHSSTGLREVSTTPLSSWFLSKGCANFVKKVDFMHDPSDDDKIVRSQHLAIPSGAENSLPKQITSNLKKNAFLESLGNNSSWRSWYGDVDVHNILDPPLSHIPEKLRVHDALLVNPIEPTINTKVTAPLNETSNLDSLEAAIRQEKQRGITFSLQLLMMLQGKTVSGKSLEEEYELPSTE
ncbi:hypothetical protein CCR75_008527 [Bremia lactucae]|uniref:Uncharacterized protein n=1 Tax=Bremia lactucae TaxID=4779 RepID=A0A976FHC4_BRELC|nr:hypothetical protein CCR75_008527 [Bremia lactucae]